MILELFQRNMFIYAMTGILGVAIVQKILLRNYYKKMVNATENMGMTTKKPLRNLKTKYENSYKLNMAVHHVDSFVDKNLEKQRFMGISFLYWDKFHWQLCFLSIIVGAVGTLYDILSGQSMDKVLMTFVYTILIGTTFLFLEVTFGVSDKKNQISANMKDYFGNYLVHRMGLMTEKKEVEKVVDPVQEIVEKKTYMEEDMEYLKKCLNEIASARNIEKQEITKKEEAMLEDILKDFFL